MRLRYLIDSGSMTIRPYDLRHSKGAMKMEESTKKTLGKTSPGKALAKVSSKPIGVE
jgi:hypothetical protein